MATAREAVAIDESLYEEVNAEADRPQVSHSSLIATALRDFLDRRRTAQILAARNESLRI